MSHKTEEGNRRNIATAKIGLVIVGVRRLRMRKGFASRWISRIQVILKRVKFWPVPCFVEDRLAFDTPTKLFEAQGEPLQMLMSANNESDRFRDHSVCGSFVHVCFANFMPLTDLFRTVAR